MSEEIKDNDIKIAAKAVLRLEQVFRKAAHASTTLEDKIKYHRAVQSMERAYAQIKLHVYTFEDAEQIASTVERCNSCGHMI